MRTVLDNLVGTAIQAIRVSHGEHFIRFETDKGPFTFEATGECCSESWIAELLGVRDVIGLDVVAVEEVNLPDNAHAWVDKIKAQPDDGRTRQENDAIYAYRINTAAGSCLVVFRNSSNGYYGGELAAVKGEPHEQGLRWREPITSDDDWDAYGGGGQ